MLIKNKGKKEVAIFEIVLLVVSLFAIMWMIGSEVEVVSAEGSLCSSGGSVGVCINTDKDTCDGEIKIGLCPGGNNIRCCLPKREDVPEEKDSILPTLVTSTATGTGAKLLKEQMLSRITKTSATQQTTTVGGETGASGGSSWLLGGSTVGGQIAAGAVWTVVAYLAGRYIIGPMLGLNVKQSQGLGYSLAAGTAAGFATYIAIGAAGGSAAGPIGVVVGVVAAFVTSIFAVKNASADVVIYNCYQWDSQLGGENCKLCNNQEIPCTEYQCRSLGQGCEFVTDEVTGQSLCQWEDPNDILAPVIDTWDEALSDEDLYRYENSPTGAEIIYTDSGDGCAPAWTPVSFGITLDEMARCKFSPGILFDDYDSMPDLFFSGSAKLYNHSYQLSLPTQKSLEAENITVENGGNYEFYIRCQDGNGNANTDNYVVKFCIDDGPDTEVPIIRSTRPLNNTPFQNGQQSLNVTVLVNEPSECRWSSQDKSYELMEGNMSCSASATQSNLQYLFPCTTELDGLRNNANNDFYFRCKDQPYLEGTESESQRNTNLESYYYRLVGTEELIISDIGPSGVFTDSTSPVKVKLTAETSLGYDDGKAICSLSETGEEGSFDEFYYEYGIERYSQYQHSQKINLGEGDYSYEIRCCDKANNCDQETVEFSVEIDSGAPSIVRAFKEDDYLKIITDEPGRCVYSTFSCAYNFDEDGTSMITYSGDEDTEHYTNWNIEQNYYIKCEDEFGNRPQSSQCSLIARPFEIPELKD